MNLCKALLKQPHRRKFSKPPSDVNMLPEALASSPIDYLVIRCARAAFAFIPVSLTRAFFHLLQDRSRRRLALPVWRRVGRGGAIGATPLGASALLQAIYKCARDERGGAAAARDGGGDEIGRIAHRALASRRRHHWHSRRINTHSGGSAFYYRASTKGARRSKRLGALEELLPLLPAALAQLPQLPDADLSAAALAIVRVLGSAHQQASEVGLPEVSAALEAIGILAADPTAGPALVDADAIEVLLLWVFDGMCAVSLRYQLLTTLIAVLHLPEAMVRFTTVTESLLPTDDEEAEPSCYQQLLKMMVEPLPPMLAPPLHRICCLTAAWEASKHLVEESATVLKAECEGVESDNACVPLIRSLSEALVAIHRLRASAAAADEPKLNKPSIRRAGSTVPLLDAGSEISVAATKLIGGSNLWRAVLATLAAPAVRMSSLLPSITASVAELLDILVGSVGGALSLCDDPKLFSALLEVLPTPKVDG